jgi:uncharacterized protein YjbI with pentapeptide repeats
VALPFARSADFPVDKAGGDPCHNLQRDFRCGIHERLSESGFRGCTVFDCFGAGQQVSQVTFAGQDWRSSSRGTAGPMFAVFAVMRQLHEMLYYLAEALGWLAVAPVHGELAAARDEIVGLTHADAARLRALDLPELRSRVGELLSRASELVRAQDSRVGKRPRSRGRVGSRRGKAPRLERGADLIGVDLRTADLVGADLRGACLIAADLRGTDLSRVDLRGADLRDADLRGADLSRGLFVTQPQVNAARGDAWTTIPSSLARPESWTPVDATLNT